MTLPSRPVANTTIDSEWGQAVHDWTFAPAGAHVRNSGTVTKNSTPGILPLTEAVDDPGGWLDAANNQVIVPADKGGLYLVVLVIDSVNGTAGDGTRAFISLNGGLINRALEDSEGGTHIKVTVVALLPLTPGDILQGWCARKGSGTAPTVYIDAYQFLRLGDGYGA